jgi:hypothetical protein
MRRRREKKVYCFPLEKRKQAATASEAAAEKEKRIERKDKAARVKQQVHKFAF